MPVKELTIEEVKERLRGMGRRHWIPPKDPRYGYIRRWKSFEDNCKPCEGCHTPTLGPRVCLCSATCKNYPHFNFYVIQSHIEDLHRDYLFREWIGKKNDKQEEYERLNPDGIWK